MKCEAQPKASRADESDLTIAIRLPNWLGDTVMAVPALQAIASASPRTRVVAVGPWARLLAGQGLAETCVEYPRSWSGRIRSADTVAALRPDVAVVLPNSFEAALSAWYWRAGRRIGFDTQGRGRLLTDRLPLPCPRQHQIDEYLALAAPLDAPPLTRRPSLSIAAMGDLGDRARALLDEIGVRERPIAGMHLGAAFGPSKLWPADRIAALCAGLRARGVTPVLLGPPTDAPIEQDVQAGLSAPVPSLIGRDTPELMPGVLAALDVLVSGDTGTAHLAAALGVRTVTLFGPTDPDLSSPRGDSAVIVGAAPCAPCFYARCPIDHVCMRAIGVEQVLDAVLGRLFKTGDLIEMGGSVLPRELSAPGELSVDASLIEMGGSVLSLHPHTPPPLPGPGSGGDELRSARDLPVPGGQP